MLNGLNVFSTICMCTILCDPCLNQSSKYLFQIEIDNIKIAFIHYSTVYTKKSLRPKYLSIYLNNLIFKLAISTNTNRILHLKYSYCLCVHFKRVFFLFFSINKSIFLLNRRSNLTHGIIYQIFFQLRI